MNEFKNYVHQIVNNLSCTQKEKDDLAEEFMDHLSLLKKEYVKMGHSENDAIVEAIIDFGSIHKIEKALQKTIKPYNKILSKIVSICFAIYSLVAFLALLSPFRTMARVLRWSKEHGEYVKPGFIPFQTISEYILNIHQINTTVIVDNLVGNIVFFIPLGFLVPIVFNKGKDVKSIIVISLIVAISIELLQYIFNLGIADVDDVILYVIGSLIGFSGYKSIMYIVQVYNHKNVFRHKTSNP